MLSIEALALTDVGLKRESNQDSILIDNELGLYIVADGMGGHRGGEVASAMAIESAQQTLKEGLMGRSQVNERELIIKTFKIASQTIYDRGLNESHLRGMATTMVLAFVRNERLFIGNVGDSRAYLLSPPGLWQLTEDHSLYNEQLKAGLIKNMEREMFEGKNIITRSVGFEPEVLCDVFEMQLSRGDMILLCSDGLHGLVSDQSIANICFTLNNQEAVNRLIAEAKVRGGDDNISVVLLRVVSN